EDLLDISRIMQGKLSLIVAPVNLTYVIAAAVETVRLQAEAKNIQIALDIDSPLAPVSGDVARLQQVVWNLLTNAAKFTPNGGQVTVELRQLEQSAQIRVIDTGKGIHASFLPHVFEYFRQEDGSTTRRFGGLGLGLAIVRQIVEMHGGTVTAESPGENQGATFTVQLPVMQQAVSIVSELTRDQAKTETPLENLQILLVDDDPDTREFQAFLLQENGAIVTAVDSGLAALQALEQFIPDVLVSDVGMADIDGYMLIQQIRLRPTAQGGSVPAIALTAYAAELDRQKALQAGFQAHITKPVEPEILVEAIVGLLKHK
ncbi:MAG TPA: ATP-binding protein, partial [Crinalium sp.]